MRHRERLASTVSTIRFGEFVGETLTATGMVAFFGEKPFLIGASMQGGGWLTGKSSAEQDSDMG